MSDRAEEAESGTPSPDSALPDPAELIARLFPKRRVRLVVEADLDPIPGWGHEPEDWQRLVQRHLDERVPHYHPTVTIQETR